MQHALLQLFNPGLYPPPAMLPPADVEKDMQERPLLALDRRDGVLKQIGTTRGELRAEPAQSSLQELKRLRREEAKERLDRLDATQNRRHVLPVIPGVGR